jgi:hypothetical protein
VDRDEARYRLLEGRRSISLTTGPRSRSQQVIR